jgi:ubiquinone/menaquinone biosynthesis C-methylase UbiE
VPVPERMNQAEYEGLYRLEESLWWFVGMRRLVDDLLNGLSSVPPPGARCLEAGCGAGFNALDLSERYQWDVFPCDYSHHALVFSAQRGVPRLAAADVSQLPYANASFDCVTCFDVLVMLSTEGMICALQEFHRVLRPGGLLVIRVAALEWLRGQHSRLNAELHRYTLPELCGHMQRAGFSVERKTYANALLAPLVFLKRRVLEPLRLVEPGTDVRPVAPWLDRAMLAAMELDRRLIRMGWEPPFGSSAIAIGRRA